VTPPTRRRVAAGVALVVLLAAGLVKSRVLPASVATDVSGDALYAVAAYTGLVLLLPRLPRAAVAAFAALWCVGVELFQATGLPAQWAEQIPPIALMLGTGFDARDLVVYLSAVAGVWVVDTAVSAPRRLPSRRGSPTMEE
jgi:hypothetical protein